MRPPLEWRGGVKRKERRPCPLRSRGIGVEWRSDRLSVCLRLRSGWCVLPFFPPSFSSFPCCPLAGWLLSVWLLAECSGVGGPMSQRDVRGFLFAVRSFGALG